MIPFDPDWCVAPGETLREWMKRERFERGWVAHRCRLPTVVVSRILEGDEPITKDIAESLEFGTGIVAAFWINLERNYREGLAAGKTRL